MQSLLQQLRRASEEADTIEIARLILRILKAATGSEARLRSYRELVQQHEASLLAAGEEADTLRIAEIAGKLGRAMFALRHEVLPRAECDGLIMVLKKAGDEADTVLMAGTFERLVNLCNSESATEKTKAHVKTLNGKRDGVAAAVGGANWDEVGPALGDLLWSLAEARPDFEELPIWIAEEQTNDGLDKRVAMAAEQADSILTKVIDRYGDAADRASSLQMRSLFLRGRPGIPSGEFAMFATEVAARAAGCRKGVQRLPLAIRDNTLHIGRHTTISFNRTLRIPEDGREYPLPAGFGRLPILRVEDYAERVPEQWLEQGGFIIPLYQREALFLEFTGVKWRPNIAKVSVGRVNAISGKEHDLKIRPHRQDYVVIPDQRWLDGINSGDGSVSQFVAMPLGKGYTIEAQVTDEEKYGGFQLAVFDPRRGRFPELDPEQVELARTALADRSRHAAQEEVLRILPAPGVAAVRALQKMPYYDAARSIGISEEEILGVVKMIRTLMGKHGLAGFIPEANLIDNRGVLSSRPGRAAFMPRTEVLGAARVSTEDEEMGIAAGGRIKQQILEDSYGAESWDEAIFRDVVIHIVNSEVYQRITGLHTPPCPITADSYHRYKIPWYSDYDEKAKAVAPVGVFKRILSIGKIDQHRGIPAEEGLRHAVNPAQIVRIRTQTLEERWKALVERARQSFGKGHHRIAAREASLALDLSDKLPLPFLIRAVSNHALGLNADAEADASACLKLQPDNIGALTVRAYACLELGEVLLAKEDAEKVLVAQPDNPKGLYLRAEANLQLKHYADALSDAEKLLRSDPGNEEALRIKAGALTEIA
jgi:hypothetical protein